MSEFVAQIPLAFASGLISVFSPCVMPLMPAYLSLISGVSVRELGEGQGDRAQRQRVMDACLGFVAGFSTVFIVLGASAFALGRVLRVWHVELFGFPIGIAQLAGVVIVVFGLHMTGLLRIGWLLRDTRLQLDMGPPGFLGAFTVGAGFGFGWSPCIGPILGAVLTLAGSRETVFEGITLLAVYSMGLGIPFLVAGWSIDHFFNAFARIKRHFRTLEIVSGLLLVGVGLLLVTNRLAWFNTHLTFLSDFVVAAEEMLQ
ncbi:MAG: cytochrome c biogenesis protein CcdA [Spirochaetaceae bacterium]|nr:cytochrome c biogenesis protein CcdA [Myxococcales bacterium]MCB9722959.1 cytochrome c biogenesis protein CcdA [Spirochaetaceae bacterium]HPG26116.1 cytochrome c biogenesis CcdA family protein [Myxococcota bacterium]